MEKIFKIQIVILVLILLHGGLGAYNAYRHTQFVKVVDQELVELNLRIATLEQANAD